MSTPTRFTEVQPAHTDARVMASRSRQATFERGVALAIVASMREELVRLQTLPEGLRWLIQDEDVASVRHWLDNLHGDILRAERIEERRDRE